MKVALYFILMVLPAFLWEINPIYWVDNLYSFSQLLGILGFSAFYLQFLLSAKLPLVDKLFGFSKAYSLHVFGGIFGILAIWAHHLIKLYYNYPPSTQTALGFLSLLILTATIVGGGLLLSGKLYRRFLIIRKWRAFISELLGLEYQKSKILHNLSALTLPLLLMHFFLSAAYINEPILRIYILLVACFCTTFYLMSKLYYKSWSLPVLDYEKQGDVHHLILEKNLYTWKSGQFTYLQFPDLGREKHPFSISSSSRDSTLKFSIKDCGDFTHKLDHIKPGQSIKCGIPIGGYELPHQGVPLTYFAGGIGITPFFSMIRELQGKCYLFWSLRYRHELFRMVEMEDNPKIQYHIHISSEDNRGFYPRLNPEHFDQLPTLEGYFFICGPGGFNDFVNRELLKRGIPKSKIRKEGFGF